MSTALLPGPLGELPMDVQRKINACIPDSERDPNGVEGLTLRGMIAMMEAVKRYGPPSFAVIASATIPEMIAADKIARGISE